jgi:hypothetical protein
MRTNQYIFLAAAIVAGILWVFLVQNWLFLNVFPGILVGDGLDLEDYLQVGSSPSFRALWITSIAALISWFASTLTGCPRNSADVRGKRPQWWLTTFGLIGLGCLYQLFFTVFIWQIRSASPVEGSNINYYPIPLSGFILLMMFVVLDVLILFWMPTLVASPRNYRFVVPGAVKIFGGR